MVRLARLSNLAPCNAPVFSGSPLRGERSFLPSGQYKPLLRAEYGLESKKPA